MSVDHREKTLFVNKLTMINAINQHAGIRNRDFQLIMSSSVKHYRFRRLYKEDLFLFFQESGE